MWQKCPICDGEGRVTSNGVSSSVHQMCPVCKGAKIISELTGLPPNNAVTPHISQTSKTSTVMVQRKISHDFVPSDDPKICSICRCLKYSHPTLSFT